MVYFKWITIIRETIIIWRILIITFPKREKLLGLQLCLFILFSVSFWSSGSLFWKGISIVWFFFIIFNNAVIETFPFFSHWIFFPRPCSFFSLFRLRQNFHIPVSDLFRNQHSASTILSSNVGEEAERTEMAFFTYSGISWSQRRWRWRFITILKDELKQYFI